MNAVGADDALSLAAKVLGPLARHDEPIGARTTYRVGGTAALFVEVRERDELDVVLEALRSSGITLLILGKGSNLLIADSGFRGLAITLGGTYEQLDVANDDSSVEAGGGLAYPVLARRLAALGLSGMGWAVGIPGSVGGAVAMNAGGHGASTAECLLHATVLSLRDGSESRLDAKALDFSYRHSDLTSDSLVLSARFRVAAGERSALEAEINDIVSWRREHQPGGRNAGSVFKNPVGDAAGRLLEEAGAKGLRIGSAEVSTKHANFIGADSGGSAADVYAVIRQAQALVAARFGVELSPEVRLIGFDQ